MISPPQSSTSVNLRDDLWPPGFRFHPTDEELILYYLKRKICRRKLKLDIIAEVDVYKWEPEDLPELSSLKNGDRQWFFFSPRDRKYPNCSRANRATKQGYWKTTGKNRTITCNSRDVGVKKTLVFYRGRAPTGQRTDWVMHEYTLEEDELRRCQNVHDCYAIYKMFKKSGPGPKNGEQYGAPFREEDWADDNFLKNSNNCNQLNSDHQHQQKDNVSHAETCRSAQVDVSKTGIDELLNNVVEVDDHASWPVDIDDFDYALAKFLGEEEAGSMVNASVGEAVYIEPCTTHTSDPHQNKNSNYVFGQLWDATEVTSSVKCGFMPEETYPTFLDRQLSVNDFLEMDDLFVPEPVDGPSIDVQQTIDIYENTQFRDADLFLGDFAPNNQTAPPTRYPWLQEDGFSDQVELYPDSVSTFGNETRNHNVHSYLHNPSEASRRTMPLQPPGALYATVSENLPAETNKSGNETRTQEAQPWLSSTLWSFVESIPASPASAAETVLTNKAFKRVSSFSRVKVTSKRTVTGTSGAGKSDSVRVRSKTKGFFFFFVFSFLAALFAVVCVFFGSHSSGRLHCRINL
ncbi:hypothetical protein RND81_08G023900 [Saponaria officinalis]|uniref:NAC domain-containing protein n=1 Tax=Saponaria officinalis TaxID=3572 RepID=A0AAW1J301_SAPOF